MNIPINGLEDMTNFGVRLGALLADTTTIELIGDVGAGKTTLTKAIAKGLGVEDTVQSPSFTISQVYQARAGLKLAHYDFYRLKDAGIMRDELSEMASAPHTVVVIEWAEIVQDVLPADRLTIRFRTLSDTHRMLEIEARGPISQQLVDRL